MRLLVTGGSCSFFDREFGLCAVNQDEFLLEDPETNLYSAEFRQVYPYDNEDEFTLCCEKRGNELFYTFNDLNPLSESGMVCFNMDTEEVVWKYQGFCITDRYTFFNDQIYAAVGALQGDSFFRGVIAIDLTNGVKTAEHGGSWCGVYTEPACVGNYVIQAIDGNYESEGEPYICCMEAETLDEVWSHPYPGDGYGLYSGSNVQVNNGIVYRPSVTGVWLYDLETGEILGADYSIRASDAFNIMTSYKYKDLLIIQNSSSLVGIRMNYTRNAAGELVKE